METPIKRVIIEEYEDRIEIDGEAWRKKALEKSLSGHLYHGSAMETSSSCGNCDGANCDTCAPVWTVFRVRVPDRPFTSWTRFDDKAEAEAYYNSI